MTLHDSIIANNVLYGGYIRDGGGIWSGTACVMRNCLVTGNTASEEYSGGYYKHGDGLYVSGGSTRLENCTVAYNAGHGIYQSAGTVAVTNSIIWGNMDDVVGAVALGYSDIEDGDNNTTNGCIMSAPLFERGFYLATNSPCTNAGTGSAADWGLGGPYTTQTDGSPDAGTVDMGYHYPMGYDSSYADLYVATNGNDANSGTNWTEAFRTITKALSETRDGTTVHVGSGSYTTASGETFPLTVASLMSVQILGTNRATTVIDASGSNKRVMTVSGCESVTVVDMTLTGGYQPDVSGGGGILLSNCGGVLLAGCAITNNGTQGNNAPGGGICSKDSIVTVSNCLVSGNSILCANGGHGGGIYTGGGGAMGLYDTIVADNLLYSGSVRNGGGIWAGTTCLMRNCLVTGNSASLKGDGIYINSGNTRLENCTIANNPPQGVYQASGSVGVTNSIIWGNGDDVVGTVTLGYSDVEDGDSNGVNGNLSLDPLFVNTNVADYRLMRTSPCGNAGTNMDWMLSAVDLDGVPRLKGPRVDMGAYESPGMPGTVFVVR